MHKAAAVITFTIPGLRFFHQGQFEGKKKRISPHLVRGPQEPVNEDLKAFYHQLLGVLNNPILKTGEWQWVECTPAWEGNNSCDAFVAHIWVEDDGERIVVVNYAPHQSQCYLQLPLADLAYNQWQLQDLMSDAVYNRNGEELQKTGLYLDMAPWQYHVFEMKYLNSDYDSKKHNSITSWAAIAQQ
jgi:hypothetical protein